MYIIAGLGNPTRTYEGTRHNIGFEVIDRLADSFRIDVSIQKNKALCGKGVIEGQKVILAKPQTYMNLSGDSLRELAAYYKVEPENIIVVFDDISLEPGQIRIRKKGSAGGHNGMKNIIAHLGTEKFPRIRVGIGAKPPEWDLADYVLAPFGREAGKLVSDAVKDAASALEMILQGDIDGAMNRYNHRESGKGKEA